METTLETIEVTESLRPKQQILECHKRVSANKRFGTSIIHESWKMVPVLQDASKGGFVAIEKGS